MKKNTRKNEQKGREYVNILGINVLSTRPDQVLAGVEKNISYSGAEAHNVKFTILTPNPELVLLSQNNPELKKALNSADFAIPDGVGLSYASKFLFGKNLRIIPGRKLFDELIKLSVKNHWKVFLLGGMGDEARIAAKQLTINNPQLSIEAFKGPILNNRAEPVSEVDKRLQKDAIDKINKFSPDLLFVAFGNPKQEIWVMENAKKLNAKCTMAVGGTFRYVAGISKLPPDWLASLGLEWVYRLITEPYRAVRIFNAFPIFPLKVFWSKLTSKQ